MPGLGDETKISLYRILQEGLTNIWKHARATRIDVALGKNKTEIVLVISDNGTGFQQEAERSGLGILGIQERLTLLGGRLEIQTVPQKGTRLRAHIPLPDTKEYTQEA